MSKISLKIINENFILISQGPMRLNELKNFHGGNLSLECSTVAKPMMTSVLNHEMAWQNAGDNPSPELMLT